MIKQYYQDLFIEKSWQTLIELKKQIDFILIGGWAVYLYTKALKSKDIDIIVDYSELNLFRDKFGAYRNDRLKKYEVKQEGIDIDVYLPYFSELGLPVEEIVKHKSKIDTFTVLQKEMLMITKQKAYLSRKATIKGQKDKFDIIALLFGKDFDIKLYRKLLIEYKLTEYKKILEDILSSTREVTELNLNRHYFALEKKKILIKLKNN